MMVLMLSLLLLVHWRGLVVLLFELIVLLVSHGALLDVLWLGSMLLAVLLLDWVSFAEATYVVLLIKTSFWLGLVVACCLVALNWLVGLCRQGLVWFESTLLGLVLLLLLELQGRLCCLLWRAKVCWSCFKHGRLACDKRLSRSWEFHSFWLCRGRLALLMQGFYDKRLLVPVYFPQELLGHNVQAVTLNFTVVSFKLTQIPRSSTDYTGEFHFLSLRFFTLLD